jgi:hypothetical protein
LNRGKREKKKRGGHKDTNETSGHTERSVGCVQVYGKRYPHTSTCQCVDGTLGGERIAVVEPNCGRIRETTAPLATTLQFVVTFDRVIGTMLSCDNPPGCALLGTNFSNLRRYLDNYGLSIDPYPLKDTGVLVEVLVCS